MLERPKNVKASHCIANIVQIIRTMPKKINEKLI